MSGITTKGIKKSRPNKSIQPGNVVARITGLKIGKSDKPKDPNVDEFYIAIDLETKPIGGDFEGFQKDRNDPSKGHWKGQIKTIYSSTFPIKYKEGVSKKSGKPYKIDPQKEILKFLQELVVAAGFPNLLTDTYGDREFASWNELIRQIVIDTQLSKIWFKWCLAATQKKKDGGYNEYSMYLPEIVYGAVEKRFAREDSDVPVVQFDVSKHIYVREQQPQNLDNAYNTGISEGDASFDEGVGASLNDNALFEGADDFNFDAGGDFEFNGGEDDPF